jgi:Flp pilus assembly protein TadD
MSGMKIGVLALLAVGCASNATMLKQQQEGENLRAELAETYVKKGAYDAATPLLAHALADHPTDAHLHILYGTVLRERGLYPQAEKEFLTAIELSSRAAAAWAGIAMLYDHMRRPEEAERAHRRALELAPRNATYWNNFGFSLFVAKDPKKLDEAVAALERALSLDPGMVVAYNNLGFAYGRRGDYRDAERAFRNGGGEVAAKLNLALVYEQNGDDVMAEKLRAAADAQTEVK